MSVVGLVMNLVLVALLTAALAMGWRLNRRLKSLRDSHDGFAAAVAELNTAAQRAEQGLADLRAATDEATDFLSDRIEKGRALAAKLEKLALAAPAPARESHSRAEAAAAPPPVRAMAPVMPPVRKDTAEHRLGALLAAAREGRTTPAPAPLEQVAPRREPVAVRSAAADDDLFDDAPVSLDRYAGASR